MTEIHIREFTQVFYDEIVRKFKVKSQSRNLFKELLIEAVTIYSDLLIANIILVSAYHTPSISEDVDVFGKSYALNINLLDKMAEIMKEEDRKSYLIASTSSLTMRLSTLHTFFEKEDAKEWHKRKKEILLFMKSATETAKELIEEMGKVKAVT